MNKKLLALAILFCAIISFGSCVNDDDETGTVDEEWKAYNDKQVRDASATGSGYASRTSISGNGSVYWKSVDDFTSVSMDGTVTDENRTPLFSDSIIMRYEGSFYQLDGTKYTFDTTEESGISIKMRMNSSTSTLIDGFSTMLQGMKIDQQVEVCIPYILGYGTIGSYRNNIQVIPGYTTLWFKIKLLNIYDEDPKVRAWVKR